MGAQFALSRTADAHVATSGAHAAIVAKPFVSNDGSAGRVRAGSLGRLVGEVRRIPASRPLPQDLIHMLWALEKRPADIVGGLHA